MIGRMNNEKINQYASEHNAIIKDVKYDENYWAGHYSVLANAIFEIKDKDYDSELVQE